MSDKISEADLKNYYEAVDGASNVKNSTNGTPRPVNTASRGGKTCCPCPTNTVLVTIASTFDNCHGIDWLQ